MNLKPTQAKALAQSCRCRGGRGIPIKALRTLHNLKLIVEIPRVSELTCVRVSYVPIRPQNLSIRYIEIYFIFA